MNITVRRATPADANGACDAVRRSIGDLCSDDHQNDAVTLSAWLANKTPARFEGWIRDESRCCVVAVRGSEVCGYGQLNRSGEIALLYVAPEMRFLGASTLMLQSLEDQASAWGMTNVFLNSSVTAKRFYERRGYEQSGEAAAGFGVTRMFPMTKAVAGSQSD